MMKRVNKERNIEIIEIDGGVVATIYEGETHKGEIAYFEGPETFAEASLRAVEGVMSDYIYKEDDELILIAEDGEIERKGIYVVERITGGYNKTTGEYFDDLGNVYDEPKYIVCDPEEEEEFEINHSEILARVNNFYDYGDSEDDHEEFYDDCEEGDEHFDVVVQRFLDKVAQEEEEKDEDDDQEKIYKRFEELEKALREIIALNKSLQEEYRGSHIKELLLRKLLTVYGFHAAEIAQEFVGEEFWKQEAKLFNGLIKAVEDYDLHIVKIPMNDFIENRVKDCFKKENKANKKDFIKEIKKMLPEGEFKIHVKETNDIDAMMGKAKTIEKAFIVLDLLSNRHDEEGNTIEVDGGKIFLEPEKGLRVNLYRRETNGKEEFDLTELEKYLAAKK